jgi:hypothetical protein
MPEKPKPSRTERFTMLEPKGPNNPSPEELATPVVEMCVGQRFTMLEPKGPNNPSPEELATPVVEMRINDAPPAVPPAVQSLIVQLADAISALDPGPRSAAVDSAVAELTKRAAG